MSENLLVSEIPDTEVVQGVLRSLRDSGLVAAVGGSGLLATLGLINHVRDWDVTTDGPSTAVETSLSIAGISFKNADVGSGVYATAERYTVDGGDHLVDVIVGFAVRVDGHRVELPTRVSGVWRGLPLADPSVWEQAYRIMGQTFKADLLARWLD